MSSEKIRKLIQRLGGRVVADIVRVTVRSVDVSEGVFCGSVEGEPDYEDIRCGMGGLMVYPKVGSMALIAHVSGCETDSYLLTCEAIDEVVFDGGSNKGMVKVSELVERLNNIETAFNELLNHYKTHQHTVNSSTFTTVNMVVPSVQTPISPLTQLSDIENEKVKH